MQAVSSFLSFGGMGKYHINKGSLDTGFGAVYDDNKTVFAAEYDTGVSKD